MKEEAPSARREEQWDLKDSTSLGGLLVREAESLPWWSLSLVGSWSILFGVCQRVTSNTVTQVSFLRRGFLHAESHLPPYLLVSEHFNTWVGLLFQKALSSPPSHGSRAELVTHSWRVWQWMLFASKSWPDTGSKGLETTVAATVFAWGSCYPAKPPSRQMSPKLCLRIPSEPAAPSNTFMGQGETSQTSKYSSFRWPPSERPLFAEQF